MRTTVQRDRKSRRRELQVCLCLSMCTALVMQGVLVPAGCCGEIPQAGVSSTALISHSSGGWTLETRPAARPGQDALPKDASLCSSWQKGLRRQAAINVTKSNREIQRNPECPSGEREKTRVTDPGSGVGSGLPGDNVCQPPGQTTEELGGEARRSWLGAAGQAAGHPRARGVGGQTIT